MKPLKRKEIDRRRKERDRPNDFKGKVCFGREREKKKKERKKEKERNGLGMKVCVRREEDKYFEKRDEI